jgi:hypothetical protein
MFMVYDDETRWTQPSPEEMAKLIEEFNAFHTEVANREVVMGERLHPTSTATTVRVRNGQRLMTDGPFAETKEQLGGVYVFECKDLDEALDIAAKIPTAKTGSIEIRPIFLPPDDMQ